MTSNLKVHAICDGMTVSGVAQHKYIYNMLYEKGFDVYLYIHGSDAATFFHQAVQILCRPQQSFLFFPLTLYCHVERRLARVHLLTLLLFSMQDFYLVVIFLLK